MQYGVCATPEDTPALAEAGFEYVELNTQVFLKPEKDEAALRRVLMIDAGGRRSIHKPGWHSHIPPGRVWQRRWPYLPVPRSGGTARGSRDRCGCPIHRLSYPIQLHLQANEILLA